MSSLTGCIAKAGKYLHADDRAAIHLAAQELRSQGIDPTEAARQAIAKQLQAMSDQRAQVEGPVFEQKGPKINPSSGVIAAGTVLYHGTRGTLDPNSKAPLYLTDNKRDAWAYAEGLIPGTGMGQKGKPITLAFTVTDDAKVLDANDRVNDAVMDLSDETVDDAINAAVAEARADGYDFVWFEHPSIDGNEMNALVAVDADSILMEGEGGPPLYQASKDAPPRATFNPQTLTIRLLQDANLSTFLHESGHAFLEITSRLAAQPDAPQIIKEDFAKTLKWFGIKGTEEVGGTDVGGVLSQTNAPSERVLRAEQIIAGIDHEEQAVLYHSGDASLDATLQNGIEPRFGGWLEEVLAGATDDEETDQAIRDQSPVAFYSEAPGWVTMKVARSLGKSVRDVTANDIRQSGQLSIVVVDKDDSSIWREQGDGTAEQFAGKARRSYTMSEVPFGVERGDVFTTDVFIPEITLTGDDLVQFLKRNAPGENLLSGVLEQGGKAKPAAPATIKRTPEETWAAMTLDQQRPYHERWAESFEAYLMEGRAPSLELRGPFERFRGWMLQVYGSLKAFLRTRQPATGGGDLEQAAYHGTPHRGIDKFSTDKIGTGEGAQAYGWGLYFAGKKEIAEYYRKTLGAMAFAYDGESIPDDTPEHVAAELLFGQQGDKAGALEDAKGFERKIRVQIESAIKRFDYAKLQRGGQLYEVEVPEDDTLLLWDKPLSEQPAGVRKAIEKAQLASTTEDVGAEAGALIRELAAQPGVAEWARKDLEAEAKKVETMKDPKRVAVILKPLQMDFGINPDGGVFAAVAQKFLDFAKQLNLATVGEGNKGGQALYTLLGAKLGNDKAASDALAAIGIKGIKYLDGTSRSAGEGSFNYVIFSGDDVAIKQTFYQGKSTADPLKLSDEVRGVFDRLLATQEQIEEAETQARFEAIYKSAEDAGMDEQEWAVYQEMHKDGTDAALTEMQARSVADMKWANNARTKALKALQATVETQRKAMKAEVTAEVEALPVEQARAYIKDQRVSTPEQKQAVADWKKARADVVAASLAEQRAALEAANPEAKGLALAHLLADEKKTFANQAEAAAIAWEKANPYPTPQLPAVEMDMIADMFGFSSGDELAKTMAEQPQAKDLIEAMTETRLREKYGEDHSPAALAQAANEAVHNEARARFIATEMVTMQRALSQTEKVGKTSVNVIVRSAKEFAKALVGRTKVMDLRPGKYAAAERKAGAAAQKAQKAGKQAEAIAAQRDRLLNLYAVKESIKARDEVDRTVAYLKRVQESKSIDAGYLDQIQALLERVDLRNISQQEIGRRKSLSAWVDEQLAIGIEPEIPAELLDNSRLSSYKEMTVAELRALSDTVKQIEHLGRLKNRLLTAKDQREFAAARDAIAGSIEKYAGDREANTRTPTTNAGRWFQAVKNFAAAHIKAATLARIMDGGKDGGLVWEYLIRPANERGDMETKMRAEATEALHKIIDPWLSAGKNGGSGVYFPTIKRSLNRESILAIALNTGNDGNLQRLLGGEGWTLQQISPVLNTLSAKDWEVVQGVWDYFESYKPLIGEKQKRVYGTEPDWITPGSAVTGTYGVKGGYYPIKYDPAASVRAEEHADAEGAKRQLQGAYGAATTRRSFTKSRVDEVVGRPLLYTMSGLYSGVNDVIHDLAWHEWLIDTNRLLKSEAIDTAIRSHYGPEAVRQFKAWRDDIAEGDAAAQAAMDGALSRLRQGVSVAGLGFNVMSALMQPLGMTQSIVRVGAKHIGRGVMQYIGNPVAATKDVHERSDMMAARARTRFRELNELRNAVQGNNGTREAVGKYAYWLMMQLQQMVDVPTWLGAYDKAISEGNDDARAVALSDQAVIDSQGGGQTKDQSAIERGGPAQKLFTVFYSFMNTALNLGVGQAATNEATTKGRAKLAADMLLLYTFPAVMGALLKDALTPGDSGDSDDWKKLIRKLIGEQLAFLLGLMVVAREFGEVGKSLFSLSDHPRDYQGPAGVRLVADAGSAAKQIHQGGFDDALRKSLVNLGGDLLGLPAAQTNRTITGAKALKEGKTKNPAALLLGYQEPK